MRKVLIANRGEIAVRVIRACRDAGLTSVAVYAEQDIDGLHTRLADEAYALDGATAAETYLDIEKIVKVAAESGADGVHPGYGFLAENADFARAVLDGRADLDRAAARGHRGARGQGPGPAHRAGGRSPARAGHVRPGVGRRRKSSRSPRSTACPSRSRPRSAAAAAGSRSPATMEEIPDLYESAVREAMAAFGRGECFVERYLDQPRHVEAQCSPTPTATSWWSHPGLLAAAPEPEAGRGGARAVPDQRAASGCSTPRPRRSAARPATRAPAPCEFLVGQDGSISFLEVNTRLQVEHPVTEEVAGLDLVRESSASPRAKRCGYDDPAPRGHSFEFRINAEDPARNFLPAPGTIRPGNPPVPGCGSTSGTNRA